MEISHSFELEGMRSQFLDGLKPSGIKICDFIRQGGKLKIAIPLEEVSKELLEKEQFFPRARKVVNGDVDLNDEEFQYKQSIIVRADLSMSVGKMISQACHACLESSEVVRAKNYELWKKWRFEGAKKVVLKVDSLEHLQKLERESKRLEVPCYMIKDRGLTEIPPGTFTALAIGPDSSNVINKITSHLKLLQFE